jgi:hypothetical protein
MVVGQVSAGFGILVRRHRIHGMVSVRALLSHRRAIRRGDRSQSWCQGIRNRRLVPKRSRLGGTFALQRWLFPMQWRHAVTSRCCCGGSGQFGANGRRRRQRRRSDGSGRRLRLLLLRLLVLWWSWSTRSRLYGARAARRRRGSSQDERPLRSVQSRLGSGLLNGWRSRVGRVSGRTSGSGLKCCCCCGRRRRRAFEPFGSIVVVD